MNKRSIINIPLTSILVLLIAFSCKTHEQIKREKLVDELNVNMKDQSKLSADTSSRLLALEEKLSTVSGNFENQEHKIQTKMSEQLDSLNSRLTLLEESKRLTDKRMKQLDRNIKQVLKILKSMGRKVKPSGKRARKSTYSSAMANYRKGKNKTAKRQLLELFDNKKIKGSKRVRVLHHLGMIEYNNKQYKKALFYLGRLYTNHPKSAYNKSGLLFLGKTFQKLGKKMRPAVLCKNCCKNIPKQSSQMMLKKYWLN